MVEYFRMQFMLLFFGFLPLILVFILGLIAGRVPGRNVHRWPSSRGFQHIDEMFQKIGMGKSGPFATELINGLVHSMEVFGWATAITLATKWRWELAAFTMVPWVLFGVKRTVCYIRQPDRMARN